MEIPTPKYEIGDIFLDLKYRCKREVEGISIEIREDRDTEIRYDIRMNDPCREPYYDTVGEDEISNPKRYKKL